MNGLDDGERPIVEAVAVRKPGITCVRTGDVVEHKEASAGEAVAVRHAAHAIEARVGAIFMAQESLAQVAKRTVATRRLHDEAAAAELEEMHRALVAGVQAHRSLADGRLDRR
jgi:hypothetical protein